MQPKSFCRNLARMDLAALFPNDDYRFQMRLERGTPHDFFAPKSEHEAIVAERRHWLESEPATYSGWLPECEPLLDEAMAAMRDWGALTSEQAESLSRKANAPERCIALGAMLEPDFLLLKSGEFKLVGGCVCFPSSWNLAEKIGRPLAFIHDSVPGLNPQIGKSIHAFLGKLAPGVAWQRNNWGLTRSAELNQHPHRKLPRLDSSVSLADVWLRIEHQALVSLPRSGGILFGIRIALHSLADVKGEPSAAHGLMRALQTMPDAVADYKGISTARQRIIELITPIS